LKYIFKIDIDIINNEIDFIKSLLHIHYNNIELPLLFIQRLKNNLLEKTVQKKLPIDDLINNKERFIEYLVEKHKDIINSSPEVQLFHAFNKGTEKIESLFEFFKNITINENSNYKEWINYALKAAYLGSVVYKSGDLEYINRFENVYKILNNLYETWIIKNYSGLRTIPSVPHPAMVHHVPHYLASYYRNNLKPIALIVIDGLALNQWITLRDSLPDNNLRFIENALFAWIPTLTTVSRQALFSGKNPYEFEESINTTSKEESYWLLFWENNGLEKENVLYLKGMDSKKTQELEKTIIPHKTKIAGLIVNKIDNIMHGMEMGMEGFHNQITIFGKNDILGNLIDKLLISGFDIWITSDHGNTECSGRGQPKEASIAKTRGERVRVYKSENLINTIRDKFHWSDCWKPIGLPKDYYPLIATENNAFLPERVTAVSHGSISMNETIVPFIKVLRK